MKATVSFACALLALSLLASAGAQAQTAAAFYSVADDGTLVWIPGIIEDLPRIWLSWIAPAP